jgi:hypothetical protein
MSEKTGIGVWWIYGFGDYGWMGRNLPADEPFSRKRNLIGRIGQDLSEFLVLVGVYPFSGPVTLLRVLIDGFPLKMGFVILTKTDTE